jgi:hypothetical protein
MLNELLIVERAVGNAGVPTLLHPDMKTAGKEKPRLKVELGEQGEIVSIQPVTGEVSIWTLRKGQHNSFPFVQPKCPLWMASDLDDELRESARTKNKKSTDRREALSVLATSAQFNKKDAFDWPKKGTLDYVGKIRERLAGTGDADTSLFLATMDRFLIACKRGADDNHQHILYRLMETLVKDLERNAQDVWLEIALALLIGTFNEKESRWESGGALLFEAAGSQPSITDTKIATAVSAALLKSELSESGTCALTGERVTLLTGNFPEPNLPIGQVKLFAKNSDISANDRYVRFSKKKTKKPVLPVGMEIACRLDRALRALTSPGRHNITWRELPGEKPKQVDLLLAFVEEALDAHVAEALAEEDFSEEETDFASDFDAVDSVWNFEKRTERLIKAVQAIVNTDLSSTPVRFVVLRKVDLGNAKVVYTDVSSVADLIAAAIYWIEGERNVPPWLELPVKRKGEGKPHPMPPPHVAPLGLIDFSRWLYIRNGTERKEIQGFSAAETLGLFFAPMNGVSNLERRGAERVLRLVLTRRTPLVAGTAHALRRPDKSRKRYDYYQASRTITVLGVLLHKIGRRKEVYMNEMAFKLGQLLAAADMVHVGYCADVRGGDVPPALLGNQVFAMAQSNPRKALAMLCSRWKPYAGWAQKAAHDPKLSAKVTALIESKKKSERDQAWDIKKALRCAREIGPLAEVLAPMLDGCRVDDSFRAELLLGYIAGLPKVKKEGMDVSNEQRKEE